MVTISLREEATELLSGLLRLDTVNPPGNETKAAELLRNYLEPSGVECRLIAKVPDRANLVARLRGRDEGPTLLLLSHTDTVIADPGDGPSIRGAARCSTATCGVAERST